MAIEEKNDGEGHRPDEDFNDPVPGWPRLALLLSQTPDFAAFSRFRDLNIKSLLYYQTELTILKRKLHRAEWKDHWQGAGHASKYWKYASKLVNSQDQKSDDLKEQWRLVKNIRVVLKEYNEALLLYTQLCAIPEPEPGNMRSFRKWLRHSTAGNCEISGLGEQLTWGDFHEDQEEKRSLPRMVWDMFRAPIWPRKRVDEDLDLVATRQTQKIDGFTRWVADEFVPFHSEVRKRKRNWRKRKSNADDKERGPNGAKYMRPGPKPKNYLKKQTLTTYTENNMLKFTGYVATIVACLLPTAAIAVLSKIDGLNKLLGCLAGFATVFSIVLMFLTNSTSRVEIFMATAAYVSSPNEGIGHADYTRFSAVLVVFIQQPVVRFVDRP
ncbi:hypothetical protein B0O99DRAFT_517767 [Bisporella sp. PMI_857]|nr:hypothetical protein B0O99DRAFT_517767 [Bisporella sp. PMI_857]